MVPTRQEERAASNAPSSASAAPAVLPSLGSLFVQGERLWSAVEAAEPHSSADPEYQERVAEAIDVLERCSALLRVASVFSANETLDEINPADLRYLLIDAYLGDLQLRVVRDSTERLSVLQEAKTFLEAFMHNCETYRILSAADTKYLEQVAAGREVSDPARRREEKIARYKREKETTARLKELQELLSLSVGTGKEEDVDRDVVMAHLDLMVQRTLEHLVSVKQEREILEMAKKAEGQRRPDGAQGLAQRRDADQRLDMDIRDSSGPLLSRDGTPLRPFVITNHRQQIHEQVFRSGHRLPTMTVDEYLQKEAERGNIIQGGGSQPPKPEISDEDHAALDAETMKARAWDEFKEANPRGWGNRMNKG